MTGRGRSAVGTCREQEIARLEVRSCDGCTHVELVVCSTREADAAREVGLHDEPGAVVAGGSDACVNVWLPKLGEFVGDRDLYGAWRARREREPGREGRGFVGQSAA